MKAIKWYALAILVLFTSVGHSQNIKATSTDTTVVFKVFGLCEQCKRRIEGAAKVNGVRTAVWDIDSKMLTVKYNPSKISLEKINNKIVAVGHDTYLKKANDAVYSALPKCCLYREEIAATLLPVKADSIVNNKIEEVRFIKGVVLEEDDKGSFKPLEGASVVWTSTHSGTSTDKNGVFNLPKSEGRLIISYSGFTSDTVSIVPSGEIKVILGSGKVLREVKVNSVKPSTYISSFDPYRLQVITGKELLKAACCNLSESFETNPSVDVSFNDAITGTKQIQLLGLAGPYTQLTVENLPGPRGLATSSGLNSIPGTWVESIQLSKGTGSVANGFESIAGQINVEQKKPTSSEQLYANVYTNDVGKVDVNLNLSKKINSHWATAVLMHDDYLNKISDVNHDGFKDLPTGNLFTVLNRWSYDNEKGLMSQFGMKYLNDDKVGGQTNYDASKDKFSLNSYGSAISIKRIEGFGKLGYVFPQKKYKSIGLQISAFDHKQDSYFGFTSYKGEQLNFYSNLIYQSIINSTKHKFRTGLSFVYDQYNEDFKLNNYKRKEVVPGAFFEYTYSPSPKLDVVTGIREDHNSLYGWFTTPRVNVRYTPIQGTTIRASAGRGQRTANIFAENNGVFASSRQVQILSPVTSGAYGLQPEVSWNKGISVDQKFKLFKRVASLGLDYFRNDFINQVVVDVENARTIKFYNLGGKSFSNSFQAELTFIPIQHLETKIAYRLFDVKTTYGNQLLQRPLNATHRAFGNLSYEIGGWKFDYTASFSGRKRLPSTMDNPAAFQRGSYSPSFVIMNGQVSKTLGKKNQFDIYVGGEDLNNFKQQNAIIASEQPFGQYFDASMIWGPITGRMFYAGVRFKIK
ncbi:MAG: hypothetical protein NVS3B19_00490 [Ginsengibacter sp.]